MKMAFIDKRFTAKNVEMIEKINEILAEYQAQGFRLTLRQLYYQLVSRDMIPNTLRSYKNTGSLVSDARQAGLVDWSMIEDRNRETVEPRQLADLVIEIVEAHRDESLWQEAVQREQAMRDQLMEFADGYGEDQDE